MIIYKKVFKGLLFISLGKWCTCPFFLPRFSQSIPAPADHQCVELEGYWVSQGEMEPAADPSYILTSSVKLNLRDLARVVSAG